MKKTLIILGLFFSFNVFADDIFFTGIETTPWNQPKPGNYICNVEGNYESWSDSLSPNRQYYKEGVTGFPVSIEIIKTEINTYITLKWMHPDGSGKAVESFKYIPQPVSTNITIFGVSYPFHNEIIILNLDDTFRRIFLIDSKSEIIFRGRCKVDTS